MTLSVAEEEELAEALRHGSARERARAFDALFDGLHDRLFAVCRNLTRSSAEAEDAVQEAFLAIHQAIGSFRGESRLSTWAYRIAIHAAMRVRARARRRPGDPLDDDAPIPSGSPGPDAIAAARQEARRVQLALDRMSDDHRMVLSLFAVDGLTHDEIAGVLGIPTGTVWSRLHGARKQLAAML